MNSAKYNLVKKYFDNGLWNTARVRNAVVKNWITTVEYKEITGEVYDG